MCSVRVIKFIFTLLCVEYETNVFILFHWCFHQNHAGHWIYLASLEQTDLRVLGILILWTKIQPWYVCLLLLFTPADVHLLNLQWTQIDNCSLTMLY